MYLVQDYLWPPGTYRFMEHSSLENVIKAMQLYIYKMRKLRDQNGASLLSNLYAGLENTNINLGQCTFRCSTEGPA